MAYPINPEIDYSYADFQEEQQDFPFPGTQLDNDLANLVAAVDAINAFVQGVIRSDGKLANQSVGPDQLSAALNVGFTLQGAWASGFAYSTADGVVYNGNFYRAKFAHTSSAATRPDLSPATWQLLFSIAAISGAMSAFIYDPQNKMADAFARANHTGSQAISTVSGLQGLLDAAAAGIFKDTAAPTKVAHFDLSRITVGQDRAIAVPDQAGLTLSKWEIIRDDILSGTTAQYNVTDLGAFRKLRLSGFLYPSVSTGIGLRLSADNGANFAVGANDYALQQLSSQGTTVSSSILLSTSFALTLGNVVSPSSDASMHFSLDFEKFNKNSQTLISGTINAFNGSDYNGLVTGRRNAAVVNNALQLFCVAGVMNGYVLLEGIRG